MSKSVNSESAKPSTFLPKSAAPNNRYRGKRLRWSMTCIETYLTSINTVDDNKPSHVEGDPSQRKNPSLAAASKPFPPSSLSPEVLEGLALCHERFLQMVACELGATIMSQSSGRSAGASFQALGPNGVVDKERANPESSSTEAVPPRLNEQHIKQALTHLGMSDLFDEACTSLTSRRDTSPAGDILHSRKRGKVNSPSSSSSASLMRRGSGKRKVEWTEEELAMQERLLAKSKERLLQAHNSKDQDIQRQRDT